MKKRFLIISGLVTLGCLLGIAASTSTPVGELEFTPYSVRHHESGALARGKLSKPQTIDDLPCHRWVHYHENGRVRQLQLAAATTVQNVAVPAGSTVFFTPDGRLERVWFARDTTIHGIPVRGGGKIATGIHPNGRVASCFLRRAAVIDGVPCRASVFKPVFFHPDGKLKEATVDRAVTIQGSEFSKGSQVCLDAHGKLVPSTGAP